MEYGCIAGTGRAVIVYFIFGIKFVGRPEGAFFSPRFPIPRFHSTPPLQGFPEFRSSSAL